MAVIERWAQALGYKEHILGIDIPHISSSSNGNIKIKYVSLLVSPSAPQQAI